mgnify:CR=1 FL=1
MSYYGPLKTWKITYIPKVMNGGMRGVAFVEADCKQQAMYAFQQQYAGQYHTVEKCEELFKQR